MSWIDRSRGACWVLAVALLTACGSTTSSGSTSSASRSASPSATASAVASPTASATATPVATDVRLVLQDYTKNQVRLAKLDATDTATQAGQFDGVVGGQAIVVNGRKILALAHSGAVTTLGTLAGLSALGGSGTVAVSPDLSQWLYTIVDTSLNSAIHLGSSTGDRIIATLPSPDGGSFYQPYAWNPSGVYVVQQATGLGGVGPFLEYHFPLGRIDPSTGKITIVSPQCVAEGVLDDGTMLCRNTTGGLEVRTPSGASHVIQLATSTSAGFDGVYSRLIVSPDHQHVVAGRNGSSDPSLVNFQIAMADVSATSATAFGPIDFYPDAWLPDGRVVADHFCWTFQQNGGPCDSSLDGTYLISADGQSKTLFYKLAQSVSVVGYI